MLTYNEYLSRVNDALARVEYPAEPRRLYEPIEYTIGLGGKRLRPVLAMMACHALGGNPDDVINVAVGIELFHNFTLIHDDVMDKADVRRGKPTVFRKWGATAAILSGDAAIGMAMRYVSRVDDAHLRKVLELINDTALGVYDGQQYDIDFEDRNDVTVDEYIHMIMLKTSVLLGCATKAGAIVADADEDVAQAMWRVGVNLGLAFQLQDDLLDVWGDEATFGKEIGGDIMNNKKTYLLINALNLAQGDLAAELNRWLNNDNAPRGEKVAAVTRIYEQLGLKQQSEQEIARYSALAKEALVDAGLNPVARAEFEQLIDRLTSRQY